MTDSLIGKQLDEYRLEKLLGQGGMARVYRGLDLGLHRYAAIKVIDTPYRQDEEYVTRFEQEARAIAQLDHPHVVTVYRYGRAENVLYMAMRYIEGADLLIILKDYERDGEYMPPDEVMRLVREIGSALDYAHSQGVIHRDVKPSNVMLNIDGRSYLTDFGLALLTDVGTKGEIIGSPQYISPEQAVSSAGAVPQSDLYSLGVILFRMMTGQLPFEHDNMLELLMLHMNAKTPDPRDFRPDISPVLAKVILKALAKEPSDRYQSGRALADALEMALKDKAVAPGEASTLSIMDRVALEKEVLPKIPAADTPQSDVLHSTRSIPAPAPAPTPLEEPTFDVLPPPAGEPPLAAGPPRQAKSNSFLKLTVGCGVLFLLILAAIFFSGIWRDAIAAVTEGTSQVETAETREAMANEGTPGAFLTETADSPSLAATPGSAEPTSTPGETFMPIVTGEGGQTESPPQSPTSTKLPTNTPSPTAAPPTEYRLLIVTNKQESLFLVNRSNDQFPLAPLRLENDNGAIEGTEWGVEYLQPGECVAIWRTSGNPQPPDVECNEVGNRVTRSGPDRFWRDSFNISYLQEPIGVCDPSGACLVVIII